MGLFGTDGIRGRMFSYPLTLNTISKVAGAYAATLVSAHAHLDPGIVIGQDTRHSSPLLESRISSTLQKYGIPVKKIGVLPTNAVPYITRQWDALGGVMITASHNPAEDNGIKFFDQRGAKCDADFEQTLESYFSSGFLIEARDSKVSEVNEEASRLYVDYLVKDVKYLGKLKIVVDCAHGASYNIASRVFDQLGVNALVINNEPNGFNINDNAGAMYPEEMLQAVIHFNADLGVALDGDGDRSVLSDEGGRIIPGENIMAAIAEDLSRKNMLHKGTLVTTHQSNLALDRYLKAVDIKVARVDIGDKYVHREMTKNGYALGGESSGHYIFGDVATSGDGLLTALRIMQMMAERRQPLSHLTSSFQLFPEVEKNVRVREKIPIDETPLAREIALIEEVLQGDGRVLVRYSGTEQLLRIKVEGKNPSDVVRYASRLERIAQRELNHG